MNNSKTASLSRGKVRLIKANQTPPPQQQSKTVVKEIVARNWVDDYKAKEEQDRRNIMHHWNSLFK